MGKYVVHFKKTATARTDTSTPKKRRDVLGSQRSSRRGVLVPVCAVAIFFICHPFVTCLYSEPSYRHRARLYVPQPWRKKSCFFFSSMSPLFEAHFSSMQPAYVGRWRRWSRDQIRLYSLFATRHLAETHFFTYRSACDVSTLDVVGRRLQFILFYSPYR